MCIIIAKPKGITVDEKFIKTMKKCFLNNPDGFGYMYPVGEKIQIKKGYMTWNNAEKELRGLMWKDVPLVLHFRVATHGKVDRYTCHPFPLSDKLGDLKSVRITAGVGIAHNGVVSFCALKKNKISDTQKFIRDYLSKMPVDVLRQEYMHKLIAKATSSKFAFMFPDKIYLVGDFVEDGGVYYSNSTYKTGRQIYNYGWGTDWYYGATKNDALDEPCELCGLSPSKHDVMDYVEGIDICICEQCLKDFFFTCADCGEVLPIEYESKKDGVCIHCHKPGWSYNY